MDKLTTITVQYEKPDQTPEEREKLKEYYTALREEDTARARTNETLAEKNRIYVKLDRERARLAVLIHNREVIRNELLREGLLIQEIRAEKREVSETS